MFEYAEDKRKMTKAKSNLCGNFCGANVNDICTKVNVDLGIGNIIWRLMTNLPSAQRRPHQLWLEVSDVPAASGIHVWLFGFNSAKPAGLALEPLSAS